MVLTLVLVIFVQVRIELENMKMTSNAGLNRFEEVRSNLSAIRCGMVIMICFVTIIFGWLTNRMLSTDYNLVKLRVYVMGSVLTFLFPLIFVLRSPNIIKYVRTSIDVHFRT